MGVPRKPAVEESTAPVLAEKEEEQSLAKSLDYVALLATLVLGIIGGVSAYTGDYETAKIVVAAVGGYVTRLYTSR